MKTVYFPAFTDLPKSSLPSQRKVYLPGGRVALETEFIMRVSSLFDRNSSVRDHARNSSKNRYFANHKAIVRTGRWPSSSTQTATYGRFTRNPSMWFNSMPMVNSNAGSHSASWFCCAANCNRGAYGEGGTDGDWNALREFQPLLAILSPLLVTSRYSTFGIVSARCR